MRSGNTNFDVRVGNTYALIGSSYAGTVVADPVCASYATPSQSVVKLNCDQPLLGRYVLVRRKPKSELPAGTSTGGGTLTVCELQIYGFQIFPSPPPPPSPPSLISKGKPATQSSTFTANGVSYDASLAVDGNTDQVRPRCRRMLGSTPATRGAGGFPVHPPPRPHALPCLQVFANGHCASTLGPLAPGNVPYGDWL